MAGTLLISVRLHQNHDWLGRGLVDLADQALVAHEQSNYIQAVTCAGRFLEGFLKQMLSELGVETDVRITLGPLIGAARKSADVPSELLERLDEANRIRNRIHEKQSPLDAITEGDSFQIISILDLVITWRGAKICGPRSTSSESDPFRVFLSVGGPHRLDQQQFLQRLRWEMQKLGVELVSLTSDEFSNDRPFDQIREIMLDCKAALVVGLERSHAYAVVERERSDREKVLPDQYIPTAWNQIEGSIASALELPVLVLRDARLHEEGIFEANNHRHLIREFDLIAGSIGLSQELCKFLASWVEHIKYDSSQPLPMG